MNFHVTPLPPGSHLVRILREGAGPGYPGYDRMIVVTELDRGKTLFLQGWVGKPLTPREWREARDRLFPWARAVEFDRAIPGTDEDRRVTLRVPRRATP